jgi:endoglucanase
MILSATGVASTEAGDAAFSAARSLGRGISLGNMLEAPHEGQWGVRLKPDLFALVKEAGFDTVRLPVRWSNHAEPSRPYRIDEGFFQRVDFAIAEALRQDLNIVVNMHHYRQLDGDPLQEGESAVENSVLQERFVAMWAQIARRYRSHATDKLFFELYNEPHGRLNPEAWNALLRKALQAVREANPERFVVIGPAEYYRVGGLPTLSLPSADRRIVVAIALYEPYGFTHQGAPWVDGSSAWLGTRCCTSEQRREVRQALDAAVAWARQHSRPVWIGEFGSHEKADYGSRVTYTRIVRQEIEARGMSWAYWQLTSNFGIFRLDRGTWHTELKDALLESDPPQPGSFPGP